MFRICAARTGQILAWWIKGQLSQWAPVGNPQGWCWLYIPIEGNCEPLDCACSPSHPRALLTAPSIMDMDGAVRACLCILGTFAQDLITVPGALPSWLCQLCFLSYGLIVYLLALWLRVCCLGFGCRCWVCPLFTVQHCPKVPSALAGAL